MSSRKCMQIKSTMKYHLNINQDDCYKNIQRQKVLAKVWRKRRPVCTL